MIGSYNLGNPIILHCFNMSSVPLSRLIDFLFKLFLSVKILKKRIILRLEYKKLEFSLILYLLVK